MNNAGRSVLTVAIAVALSIVAARITVATTGQRAPGLFNGELLTIEHASGKALRIGTAGFESPFVHFLEADGTTKMELMTTPTGHALFEMKFPNTSNPAIRIDTATPTGAARIVLFDPATGEASKTIMFDSE